MTRTLGIDVSVWQDNNSTPQQINFQKAYANGARFAFMKASQSLFADQDILYNWKSSKDSGLLRGAYHFLVWETKPELQAQFFYGLLMNDPGELPPVVDYEWWSTTPSNAINILWAFCVELKRLMGKTPILYTAPGFWQPYGQINSGWAQFPLWIADYGANDASHPKASPTVPQPWTNWIFWQYSSKGDGAAMGCESKSVDVDYFNGSYEDLCKWANYTPATQPTNPTPEPTPDPTPTQPTTPTEPSVGAEIKVTATVLNIRSGPSTLYPVVGKANQEQVFEIRDIVGNDAWIKIGDGKFICAKMMGYKYVEILK